MHGEYIEPVIHSITTHWEVLNPLALRAAKRGLTNLGIFYLQKYFLEIIWRRNVDHKPDKNSPSNIL